MNELATLLPIAPAAIGEATVQTVDARKLHAFLGNKDHFATWIKDRLGKYDFAEGVDYVTFSESSEKGRPRTEYHLALDIAREIAMVEDNEKGKQARRYFIECERELLAHLAAPVLAAPVQPLIPKTYSEALRLAASQAEIIERQDEALLLAAPKVAALDQLTAADGTFCLREAAKTLDYPPMKLIARLAEKKWIYRQNGTWIAYQERIHQGYLQHKITTIKRDGEEDKIVTQCRVTAKGIVRLRVLLNLDAQKEAA